MTQAYNLSQLANNLNSAGQLDATDGLVNAVPVVNGGTGAATAADARLNLGVPPYAGTGATGDWAIGAQRLKTANFTVEESGGKLLFKFGSTTIASMSSAGVFTPINNVVAGGTP